MKNQGGKSFRSESGLSFYKLRPLLVCLNYS
nr:MAG TPA: hypothetical protein [Caudoviricetes sp.]